MSIVKAYLILLPFSVVSCFATGDDLDSNEFNGSALEATAKRELVFPLSKISSYHEGSVVLAVRVSVYTGWNLQDIVMLNIKDQGWKCFWREGLGEKSRLGNSFIENDQKANSLFESIIDNFEDTLFSQREIGEMDVDDGYTILVSSYKDGRTKVTMFKGASINDCEVAEIVEMGKAVASFFDNKNK